ncbi:hypothetical protein [Liquorilactobacillus oeni]|nr:hypothetical protein [Liquorilactobacillus oeni]
MNTRIEKGILVLMVLGLSVATAACSSNNYSVSNSATSRTSEAETYNRALKYLKKGAPQQAYHELEKNVKNGKADKKSKELYYNIETLLTAKKAVTENKLSTAAAKLRALEQVKTPQSLIKQVKEVKGEYQAVKLAKLYYNETVAYYKAGRYSEAGGSLEMLLTLPEKYQAVAAYQEKGKAYEEQIASAQNKNVQTTSASASVTSSAAATSSSAQTSGYTNARSSKIVSSEYQQKTGSSISSATNSQVSSVAQALSDSDILGKFRSVTGIPQEAGDQYYVKKLIDSTYQIEIRHTSPNNTAVSNLKGMYKYDYKTGIAEKMNEITGQYSRIN